MRLPLLAAPGVAALLTRMSRRPSSSTARVTIAAPCSALLTSPGAAITARPWAQRRAISPAALAFPGRWFIATRAPERAKSATAASPTPDAPPVTSAVLPARSALIIVPLRSSSASPLVSLPLTFPPLSLPERGKEWRGAAPLPAGKGYSWFRLEFHHPDTLPTGPRIANGQAVRVSVGVPDEIKPRTFGW